MTIPIYPIPHAQLHKAIADIGGDRLSKWSASHQLGEEHGTSYMMFPSNEGGIGGVLLPLNDPPTLWSCASLATKLPAHRYHMELQFLGEHNTDDMHRDMALGWMLAQYRYSRYKADDAPTAPTLALPDALQKDLTPMHEAITLVRDLINTPPNDMGPEELAEAAKKLAGLHKATCTITDGRQLEKDYPAIHTVGRASVRKPRLIDLIWGDKDAPRLTLVGKGVCFDSGGLDIKGSANMLLMKKDMGGAAFTLGLAHLVMSHALPVRLRVLIPAVENSIDGNAYRPSDIITMRSGTTVEVGNTDAEGRLVLADALTEACTDKPDLLIDAATLTGAARTALGTDMPALFCTDTSLARALCDDSHLMHDPLWHMPLHEPYADKISSPIADISSTGNSRYGGAITAAMFLKHFVTSENTKWMHLDMMAWNISSKAGRPMGGEAQGLRALYYMLSRRYKG